MAESAPDLFDLVREHYIMQFRAFLIKMNQSSALGASEVKLRLSESSDLYCQLYCADFISNDEDRSATELLPETYLSFDPIVENHGAASLTIDHLRWDDVIIYHDLEAPPMDDLANWFLRWFDPDDDRYVSNAELSNVIHSMLVEAQRLSVDFGTADVEALRELLDLLERGGASSIRMSSSRAEEEANHPTA